MVIDKNNRELHRIQGTLRHDDRWWLDNNARSISLIVTHLDSPSFSRVAPNTATALPWASCAITFSAGRANYRIEVHDERHEEPPSSMVLDLEPGEATMTVGQQVFNEEQFLLLAVISEARIDGPITAANLPSSRQIAQRLGWNLTKVNRKLDNLCIKLSKAGVAGLRGDLAGSAHQRRLNLANYAVESGLVTREGFPELP